ncbi:LolA family protein [Modicisalibacter tunisiensis]|uniref:Outer membrane lipoprotein carrier protein LolA n=1 Tax=Modicisalibacter tunisiensis TaxID=390637 RepID=A0ABS7X3Z2_9GAMM|nr:outer membrane lipoprotein carrier protein LolA [Modicisalibacter tunisiensis]KXS38303.1 MAG: hypothetical protein AWU55_1520 [Halomonadaceae bacterium T82-2]MBZ9569183.1 outer membrane lipoprotein carrier protein LolA [Modicisalibacter tunisiensis]
MRLFVLLMLGLLSSPALAFDLADLQHRLGDTQGLSGRFVQTRHLADLDTDLESRGHFTYQRGKRVVWALEQPVEDRQVFTPADARAADDAPGDTGDDRRRRQIAALLLNLLDGDWQALERRFSLTLSGDATAWQVALAPRQAALRERLAEVTLAGGRYVERLRLETADGDTLTVRFSDLQPLAGSDP